MTRNERRRGTKVYVPEPVLRRMAHTLEPPWPGSDDYAKRFEVSSCIISAECDMDGCEDGEYFDGGATSALETVEACLERALRDPVSLPRRGEEVDPVGLKTERSRTLASHVHRCDRLLRALVGAVGRHCRR